MPYPDKIEYINTKTTELLKDNLQNEYLLKVFSSILFQTDFSLRKYNSIFKEIELLLKLQNGNAFSKNETMYISLLLLIKYYEPVFYNSILIKKEENLSKECREKELIKTENTKYANLIKIRTILVPQIVDSDFEGKVNQFGSYDISFSTWLKESLNISFITKSNIRKNEYKKYDTYLLQCSIEIEGNPLIFIKIGSNNSVSPKIINQAYKEVPDSLYEYKAPFEINNIDAIFISKDVINKPMLLTSL